MRKYNKKLEGYSCKQLLKDSYSNFNLTLKVNILWLVCSFKDKPLRTEKVDETAQVQLKIIKFSSFLS